MANNRGRIIHKNSYDLVYNRQARAISKEEKESSLASVQEMFNEIFEPQNYVAYGNNNDIITSPMTYYKKTNTGDRTTMDKAIDTLHKNNFFDIVTGKTQSGSTLIKETIDYNNKLNFSNQKVKANSSLTSVKEAYNNLKTTINNKGRFHVYDLETIGGTTREGVWNPIGITEFSVHTRDFKTNTTDKTDVFLGMDKRQRKDLQERIFKAIDNGTLEADGDLAVTAMRMSMYGHRNTNIVKNNKGFWEVVSFTDGKDSLSTDKEAIKRGFDWHEKAYTNTEIVDGINIAEKTVLDKIAEMQQDLTNKTAMLGGFNHTKFDDPITNKYLSDIVVKNKQLLLSTTDPDEKQRAMATLKYYNSLFKLDEGGKAVLSPSAGQTFDMRSAVDLYKGYYGVDALYAGNKGAYSGIGPRMARQEHIASAHFPKKMASGNAHQASFDVEMLTEMFLGKSEITGQGFLDYLMNGNETSKGINAIDEVNRKISVGNQLYKAKTTPAGASFTGQGHLNFVYDKKNNTFLTADGYKIGDKKQERLG
ncbi:MAG: hypothetical protein ACRDB0_01450, partial [Paraclostridium sp.]